MKKKVLLPLIAGLLLSSWPSLAEAQDARRVLSSGSIQRSVSRDYSNFDVPIAGVAGAKDLVFVGEPLNKSVVVLSSLTGKQLALLPPPPSGFVLPFILHTVSRDRLAVLDAGGLPQPQPFQPSKPVIYEYKYRFSHSRGFAARLVRTISFASVVVGFPEDFVRLEDGRYLLSDAVLGSIWIAQPDGTITPGIIPKSFAPQDRIPVLALCPAMPQISVNGYPFLFTGSTIPGVSPMAVRNGIVYYYSPCARGIYAFRLAILSDSRQPYQRADSIQLIAATPRNVAVEELLDFSFNPFNPSDPYLYAADPLQLKILRIDVSTGARQVIADGPKLFDFPSSLAFLPTTGPTSELVVVSNQQERSPITNDAVSQTTFNLPFIVAEIFTRLRR